ncbi:MAG: hypothetical protein ACOC8D_01990, partial [bacterium]
MLGGCLWTSPACYAPAWSPDGDSLYYVAARPDGTLSLRRADVASRTGTELAASRLDEPPVALALSPQGDRVACAVVTRANGRERQASVHVHAGEGADGRAVWRGPTARGTVELCWTPDGQSVVVAADRPGGWGLWLAPVGGGTPRALARGLAEARLPAVSPDGSQVAFVGRPTAKALCGLYTASLETGEASVAVPALFRTPWVGYGPAWSPDGGALAYVAERYAAEGFAEVWVYEVAAGRRRAVARTLAGSCFAPAWSPHGDRLAFVRLPFGAGPAGPQTPGSGGRPAEIVVVDAQGEQQRALAADGLANLMPAWSPDGQTIAFTTSAEPAEPRHVVRLADVATAELRLAEDAPEARVLLAMARYRRGAAAGLKKALDALADIPAGPARAFAHLTVAEAYRELGQWRVVAHHARAAAVEAPPVLRGRALGRLAEAQRRLGQPEDALHSLGRLPPEAKDARTRRTAARLRRGIETLGRVRTQLEDRSTPALLHRLGDLQRKALGNPRGARDTYFRLLDQHPGYPRAPRVAAAVFECYARLRAHRASYRVLERMAGLIGEDRLTAAQTLA